MDFQQHIDAIAELLDQNHHLIYENYNNKEDQILLDKKLVSQLSEHLFQFFSDSTHIKSALKKIIKVLFELSAKDLLLFKNGYIFIKYTSLLQQHIPNNRKNSCEVRYNGFDEKEMKEFYKKFFQQEELTNLLVDVAHLFVYEYIINKQISNIEYEQKVFSYIKEIFYHYLLDMFENDDEFMLGFAGYIFRINFEEVFYYIAEYLLEELIKSNEIVKHFLEYYTQDIFIYNQEKYLVPSIMIHQQKLKLTTIIASTNTYINATLSIITLEKKLKQLYEEIKKYCSFDGKDPLTKQQKIQKELHETSKKLQEKTFALKKAQINLDKTLKNHQYLQRKILSLQKEHKELSMQKEKLQKELPTIQTIMEYQKIKRMIEKTQQEITTKQKLIKHNQKKYDEIVYALLKALISKKKKLS